MRFPTRYLIEFKTNAEREAVFRFFLENGFAIERGAPFKPHTIKETTEKRNVSKYRFCVIDTKTGDLRVKSTDLLGYVKEYKRIDRDESPQFFVNLVRQFYKNFGISTWAMHPVLLNGRNIG